jgi:hypothetical protein
VKTLVVSTSIGLQTDGVGSEEQGEIASGPLLHASMEQAEKSLDDEMKELDPKVLTIAVDVEHLGADELRIDERQNKLKSGGSLLSGVRKDTPIARFLRQKEERDEDWV